jgi:hypothetical protein
LLTSNTGSGIGSGVISITVGINGDGRTGLFVFEEEIVFTRNTFIFPSEDIIEGIDVTVGNNGLREKSTNLGG